MCMRITGERLEDGADAAQLLLGRHRRRAGPGRLAADVEDVGAGRRQLEPVRDRPLGAEEEPAVRERVGGHVDDAHEPGHELSYWARITRPSGASSTKWWAWPARKRAHWFCGRSSAGRRGSWAISATQSP